MKIGLEYDDMIGCAKVVVIRQECGQTLARVRVSWCHIQVHLSGKLHPRGDATSEPYKPAFHGSHLSRNMSYSGAATLRVFHLPRRRYSYSTQSSMTELLLSVSQH